MGRISEKLKKQVRKIKASYQRMPLVDLRPFIQPDQGQTLPFKTLGQLQGYHPTHAIYLAAQNLVSFLAEELSALPTMAEYYDLMNRAIEEYMPEGPPLSPLTVSYFTSWAFFDAPLGPDRETIGNCLLDLGPNLGLPGDYLTAIRHMQQSRMGLYQHQGLVQGGVRLQELISKKTYTCLVPAGHRGQVGELWYVRILPPLSTGSEESLVFTTPYQLVAPGKAAWLDFLQRTMPRTGLPLSQPILTETGLETGYPALEALLKYGHDRFYWHEFIMQAYLDHRPEVILLTGLPDVPQSLPHSYKD